MTELLLGIDIGTASSKGVLVTAAVPPGADGFSCFPTSPASGRRSSTHTPGEC
jgi:hypothetical protein